MAMPLFLFMAGRRYQAPMITVVRFSTEHGYALSVGAIDPEQVNIDMMLYRELYGDDGSTVETYYGSWADGGDNGFFN